MVSQKQQLQQKKEKMRELRASSATNNIVHLTEAEKKKKYRERIRMESPEVFSNWKETDRQRHAENRNLVQDTDPARHSSRLEADRLQHAENRNLVQETDPVRHSSRLEANRLQHAANRNLVQVTDPVRHSSRLEANRLQHAANRNLVQATDPARHSTRLEANRLQHMSSREYQRMQLSNNFFCRSSDSCSGIPALNNFLGGYFFNSYVVNEIIPDYFDGELEINAIDTLLKRKHVRTFVLSEEELCRLYDAAYVSPGRWILRFLDRRDGYLTLIRKENYGQLIVMYPARVRPTTDIDFHEYFYGVFNNYKNRMDQIYLIQLDDRFCLETFRNENVALMPPEPSRRKRSLETTESNNFITTITRKRKTNKTYLERTDEQNSFNPQSFEDSLENFERSISKLNILKCSTCNEGLLSSRNINNFTCKRCTDNQRALKPTWFSSPSADPGLAPFGDKEFPALLPLTMIEHLLIALVHVQQYVYLRGIGKISATKGHCCAFSQDITDMVKTLPRLPSEINMVIIRKAGETGSNGKDFLVRRFVIQDWLRFLKKYNQSPGYKNVQISQTE
jgi:hypothetical protein